MESKGKLKGVARDFATNKWNLTFEIDGTLPAVDNLSSRDLRITAKPWKEKRSLNANAYAHKLLRQIAEASGESLTETKNRIMSEYGQVELNEDGTVQTIILRDDIPWEKIQWVHLRPTNRTRMFDDGKLYRLYMVIRGSRFYDTKEMSRLIDGIVEDAKSLDIETLTPSQIHSMKQDWRPEKYD